MVGQELWYALCCPRLFPVHPAQGGLSHPQRDTEVLGGGRFREDQVGVAVRGVEISGGGEEGTEHASQSLGSRGGVGRGHTKKLWLPSRPRPEKEG